MQLVLINNRIVAHGENFLAMGGVVINTVTGARYDNATVAECSGCPSDIDEVGYEYHAGSFVPCAPYGKGKGTGYFMEVCPDCATPRNSGLLINDINWGKVASVAGSIQSNAAESNQQNYSFSVSNSELAKYSSLRYKIKAGSVLNIARFVAGSGINSFNFISLNGLVLYGIYNIPTMNDGVLEFKEDVVIPSYLVNASTGGFALSSSSPLSGEQTAIPKWLTANGNTASPLSINVCVPGGYNTNSGWVVSSANFVIDLEGRK